MPRIFQSVFYFLNFTREELCERDTNKLDWKKAKTFLNDEFFFRLSQYNPFGPKEDEFKMYQKLAFIERNTSGVEPEQVPYLRIGAERGYGTIDFNDIHVVPENWREWISGFKSPPESIDIEFPGVEILDRNSCSACQSTGCVMFRRERACLAALLEEAGGNSLTGRSRRAARSPSASCPSRPRSPSTTSPT